jgi:GNAT superfamily N-acetyltransferase
VRSQFADDEGEVGIAVDPKAFFAVVLDGRLVGSFSIMVNSDEFAFGGFYILDPEYRGQGIGLAILEHIDRLAESYNFGISAARSPVLDIKPYLPATERIRDVKVPAWSAH